MLELEKETSKWQEDRSRRPACDEFMSSNWVIHFRVDTWVHFQLDSAWPDELTIHHRLQERYTIKVEFLHLCVRKEKASLFLTYNSELQPCRRRDITQQFETTAESEKSNHHLRIQKKKKKKQPREKETAKFQFHNCQSELMMKIRSFRSSMTLASATELSPPPPQSYSSLNSAELSCVRWRERKKEEKIWWKIDYQITTKITTLNMEKYTQTSNLKARAIALINEPSPDSISIFLSASSMLASAWSCFVC